MTEENCTADERVRKERKMKEVTVMADDGGTEIENEGWFDGKLPLQSVPVKGAFALGKKL